jgi:hypothetical protein
MYRIEDIDEIKKNINNIQDDAMLVYKTNYEPTLTESKSVYNYVLEFIKLKKRIIYGGWAQNELIKYKNKDESFYKETSEADVEFYSYEPVKDAMDLADFLKSKNLKYVGVQGGIHEATYKIFVNFINYCDISYLAKNICDNCLKLELNGIIYAHPLFLYIDFYRVFTDPLTSYWRLDKSFTRYLKLYRHYPVKQPSNKTFVIKKTNDEIISKIRKYIIHNSKLIVIGKYAYNYFVSKVNESEIDIDYYELITIDYENDNKNIYNKLQKIFPKNKISYKKYYPFFEFFDKRYEYYCDNILILKVYGSNKRCIVHHESIKKKCLFGTFQLVYLYLLSNYNYHYINKNNNEENNHLLMVYNIINAKNLYLDKHNKTVLDKTPFQEFIIKCIGTPYEPKRESRITMKIKYKKGIKPNFNYEPSDKPGKIPNLIYSNSSGNEIMKNNK